MDYFGLWIDSSFNHGHSKAKPKCTTYGSPQLSADPEFEVDIIEVWGLGPEKKEEEDSDEEKEKNVSRSNQTKTKKELFFYDQDYIHVSVEYVYIYRGHTYIFKYGFTS